MSRVVNVFLCFAFFCFSLASRADMTKDDTNSRILDKNATNRIVLSKNLKYDQLNPARGKSSPLAGDIWGNRKDTVASGFLLKFADDFSSPPHIHNITYRGIVIKGRTHNDDPEAEKEWMPKGSFWIQPAGEVHITSALGKGVTAYVEIDKGPYLVESPDESFMSQDKPLNLEASNVVWLDKNKTNWVKSGDAQISFLWKSKTIKDLLGLFLKLPKNFNGDIHSVGQSFEAIVIQGEFDYLIPQSGETVTLDEGSAFGSNGVSNHYIRNDKSEDVILYIRTNGKVEVD